MIRAQILDANTLEVLLDRRYPESVSLTEAAANLTLYAVNEGLNLDRELAVRARRP